jgi:hypothetical protein
MFSPLVLALSVISNQMAATLDECGGGVVSFVPGGFTNLVGHQNNQGIISSRLYAGTQETNQTYGSHGYSLSYGFVHVRIRTSGTYG